jgi:hypothetical protein
MSASVLQAKPKPKSSQETEEARSDLRPITIFEALARYGEEGNFKPVATPAAKKNFIPTDAPPGSEEKIDILRQRLEKGLPLWHKRDRKDYVKGGAKQMDRLFAQAAQIANRSLGETFDELEQAGVHEFDTGDGHEEDREHRREDDRSNLGSKLAQNQDLSIHVLPKLISSSEALGANGSLERATGRGKSRQRGPGAVRHSRDYTMIEQLAHRALEKRLSAKRRQLQSDMPVGGTLNEASVRERPFSATSSRSDPFSSLTLPPKASERSALQAEHAIQYSGRQATPLVSKGLMPIEASPPSSATFEAEPIQESHLEVVQVYRALKEAVALNRILPTELTRFREQHLELLRQVAPLEVA